MGNEGRGVQLSRRDQVQNLLAVTAVHAAGFEGEILPVHLRQGQELGPIVKRHHRHHRIGAGALPGQAEGLLRPGYLQHPVRAAVVAVGLCEGQHLLRPHRQHLGIVLPDKPETRRVLFADDDLLRRFQQHAQQSADACGARS